LPRKKREGVEGRAEEKREQQRSIAISSMDFHYE
jgi:hypothetical protein